MKRIHQATFSSAACAFSGALCLLAAGSLRTRADETAPPQTVGSTTTATVTDEADATATVTDEVQQGALEVQRALGGSIVDQFPSFHGAAPQAAPARAPWWKQFTGSLEIAVTAPPWAGPPVTAAQPGHWPNWSAQPPTATFIVPATAELQATPANRPVAVLRATALELEASANRLEERDLYSQADALRELAQRMRLDARKLTTNSTRPSDAESPLIDPATSWIEPSPPEEPSPTIETRTRNRGRMKVAPADPAPRRKTPARLLQGGAPGEAASGGNAGRNE